MIPTEREWRELETQRVLLVERALCGTPEFMRAITRPRQSGTKPPTSFWPPDGTWTYRNSREMPWVWFVCPKGHRIVPVRVAIDPAMGATRHDEDGRAPFELCHRDQHRDDVPVPASERAVHRSDESSWAEGRVTVWECSYEVDGDDCRVPLPWGQSYCEKHLGQPDPLVTEELFAERLSIRCKDRGGCKYAAHPKPYRQSTLLARFGVAVILGRQQPRRPGAAQGAVRLDP